MQKIILVMQERCDEATGELTPPGLNCVRHLIELLRPEIGTSTVSIRSSSLPQAVATAQIFAEAFGAAIVQDPVLSQEGKIPELASIEAWQREAEVIILVSHKEIENIAWYHWRELLGRRVRTWEAVVDYGQALVLDCEQRELRHVRWL